MNDTVYDEARADWRMARCVDTGVKLSLADGVTPALEFMQKCGVPREVAMRVLGAPRFGRHVGSENAARIEATHSSAH